MVARTGDANHEGCDLGEQTSGKLAYFPSAAPLSKAINTQRGETNHSRAGTPQLDGATAKGRPRPRQGTDSLQMRRCAEQICQENGAVPSC